MKSIRQANVDNKKVLIRVDYNVPIENGQITDDTRIIKSLKTINYLLENNAKIIILSHFGRIESQEDKDKYSLNIVAKHLSSLVDADITFIPFTRGEVLENAISNMKPRDILIIENTRFEDEPKKLESSCDETLSKYWASLADIYVFDAFASAHRYHASTYGVSKFLPSYCGFLVQKEVMVLDEVLKKEKTVIMGGAKVDGKIKVINNIIKNTNNLLLGGGMCFTFLKASGYEIGKSILSDENSELAKNLLAKNKDKIFLPIDVATDKGIFDIESIPTDAVGYDIGPRTIELYKKILIKSNLVLWNGPLGKFEDEQYEIGTKSIMEHLYNNKIPTVIAGGDIISAANKYNFDFDYLCTGGGATLEYLEGKNLKTLTRLTGESLNEE